MNREHTNIAIEELKLSQQLRKNLKELLDITYQAEAVSDWEKPSQEQLKQDYEDAN